MKYSIYICLLFIGISTGLRAQPYGALMRPDDHPIGFASMNARGQNGTTGGAGGDTITITNGDTLYTYLRSIRSDKNPTLRPKVILIKGTITAGDKMVYIKSCANVTVLGLGTNARIQGFGFEIETSQNIIIRNIEFWDCPTDGIDIRDPETHHIWVDHCSFTDGATADPGEGGDANHDGALDYKKEATHVTVSWCHFMNHSKTCLFGHTDGETADTVMCGTYHHNWFDTTWQRHPRVRFGRCHVFNNYCESNKLYGVASTCNARVVVEGCYFQNVPYPMNIGYAESPAGYLNQSNNVFDGCGTPVTNGETKQLGQPASNPHNWNPASDYAYVVDNPADVPPLVQQYAGSGKLFVTTAVEHHESIPRSRMIMENYPNPFNPSTKIRFSVDTRDHVTLKICDVLGRPVAVLFDGAADPGKDYAVTFDGTHLSSGVYFSVLQNGTTRLVNKLMLTK